jgi:hypothetical protein
MNIKLLLKPAILTFFIASYIIYLMHPDAIYSVYVGESITYISESLKFISLGFIFSVFSFFPAFMIFIIGFLLLSIMGRSLYRWSPEEHIHQILRTTVKIRFSIHGLGLFILTIAYALFIRNMDDENIKMISTCATIIFSITEIFFILIIWNCAGFALKMAKKDLILNERFRIKTTQDQCWIYSSSGDKTYRTTLKSNDKGIWTEAYSYPTQEKISDW